MSGFCLSSTDNPCGHLVFRVRKRPLPTVRMDCLTLLQRMRPEKATLKFLKILGSVARKKISLIKSSWLPSVSRNSF